MKDPRTIKKQPSLDGKPWFAEIQERHLRQIQEEGGCLIQRREDGEWVKVEPNGTETLLGYRDT